MIKLLEIALYALYFVLAVALVAAIVFIAAYLRWIWKELHDDRKREEGDPE